ncbi:MAG: helix-turn-helix transcriptional regulator [Verrucomicrobiota bacterium]
MNNLAIEINRLQKEYNKTGADLARLTGLNPAQISRWRSGEQTSIKEDCLRRLADGFSTSPKTHARLLMATIMDSCTGPGAKYVSVKLNPDVSIRETETQGRINLIPSIQEYFDIIASQVTRNRPVRDIIKAVASMCGHDRQTHQAPMVNCSNPATRAKVAPVASSLDENETATPRFCGEIPIRANLARQKLGIGSSLFSAIKSRMGLRGRKLVKYSDIVAWMDAHPRFRESEVYHRPACGCAECIAKRALPNRQGSGIKRRVQQVISVG